MGSQSQERICKDRYIEHQSERGCLYLLLFIHIITHTMTVIRRETLVALALCLTLYHLPRAEAALNCYTSASDGSIKEECGMQCHLVFNRLIEKIEKQIEKNRQIIKFTKKK